MDEKLILKMAEPYVKDGCLTYEDFEVIYEMLSRREQYQVVEILFCHDIELVDKETSEEEILEIAPDDSGECDDEQSRLRDEEIRARISRLVTASGLSSVLPPEVANGTIKQSNAILCHLIQQGNLQAAQELCIKNRMLVLKYANAYFGYFGNDLDLDDLEQAGYMGLLRAAQSFDLSRDNYFTTYAVFWIKQAISRQVADTGHTIRLPVHVIETISKVTKLEAEYDRSGIAYEDRIRMIAAEFDWSEEKVRHCIELRTRFLNTASLNMLVGEEGDTELCELLPDLDEPTPEEMVFALIRHETIEGILHEMKPREADVIRLRYGLNGEEPRTLEEIGAMFNVTRERIRQIEAKTIRKLRKNRTLRAFLED